MQNTIPFCDRVTCTVGEACAYTGVGRTKLYEEISAGRVETATLGKRRLIVVASLLLRLGVVDPQVSHG